MGGIVSPGIDNDDLIDKLVEAKYIRSTLVEKVFRSVDRAFYFLPEHRRAAYRDQAWKNGNLHLSAPCIYSEVLEQLNLQKGHSFLNIGSGTGYLSTMVGLILGPNGVNHGIEIHADVVEYAYEKLEKFKSNCNGIDVFEFCEPHFIIGNAFDLNAERKYDRIYCGAACPELYHDEIKKYMKVGGILVVPCEDDLLKIKRTGPDVWEKTSVLQVSFSMLHLPKDKTSSAPLFLDNPQCLQALCRTHIRSLLREIAEKEDAELKNLCHHRVDKKKIKKSQNRCSDNRLIIPIFENSGAYEQPTLVGGPNNGVGGGRLNFGRLIFHNYSAASFRTFVRNLAGDDDDDEDEDGIEVDTDSDSEANVTQNNGGENAAVSTNSEEGINSGTRSGNNRAPKRQLGSKNEDQLRSSERNEPSVSPNWRRRRLLHTSGERRRLSRTVKCTGLSGKGERTTAPEDQRHTVTECRKTNEIDKERIGNSSTSCDEQKRKNEPTCSKNEHKVAERENMGLTGAQAVAKEDEDSNGGHPKKLLKRERVENNSGEGSSNNQYKAKLQTFRQLFSPSDEPMELADDVENTESSQVETKKQVCNSAVDDELENGNGNEKGVRSEEDEEADCNEAEEVDEVNDSNEDDREEEDDGNEDSSDDDEDEQQEENSDDNAASAGKEAKDSLPNKYRAVMEKKIIALPLPQSVKTYLNYDRSFIFSS